MSLNTNQRRKELQRIDLENQRLLKRLESQKSTYSRRDQKSSYELSRRHARLARAHRSNSPRSLPPLPSRRRDSGALPTPRSDGGNREDTEAKAALPAGMEAEDTDGPDELPEGPVRSRPLQPSLQQDKGDSRIHSRDVRDGPDQLPGGPVRSRSLQPSLQEKGDSRIHSRDVRASRHVSPTAAPKARSVAPASGRAPAQSRVSLPRLPQPESRGSSPQIRERSAPPGRRAPAAMPNKGTAAQRTSASARPALRSNGREEHPAARREAPAKQELRAAANGPQEQVKSPAAPLSPLQKEPQEEAAIPEAWEGPCSPADATTVEEEVPEVVEEEEEEPSSPSSLPPTEPARTAEFVAPAGPGAAEAPTAQAAASASPSPSSSPSPGKGVCGLPLQAAPCAEEAAESGDEAYSEDEDFCEEAEDESTPMSKGNMTGYSHSESVSEQETSPALEKGREEQPKAKPPIVQRPSGISALSQESVSQIQAHSLATKALSTSLSALAPGGEGPGPSSPSDAGSDTPTSEGGSLNIQNDDADVVSAHSDSEDES